MAAPGRLRARTVSISIELTDNFHFFTELAQRIIRATSYWGPMGRLYQIDMRLRPTGKSGSLVIPLAEFRRYYVEGGAQLWERQALTRARAVFGEKPFADEVMDAAKQGAYGLPWKPELAEEIRLMRERLEASRGERDLKRGFGGIVDIEFLVQLFQIKYGRDFPALRTTNTWEALEVLHSSGLLTTTAYETLLASYNFLRLVESRLRIVHNLSLDELPDKPEDLEKLARRLGFEPGPQGSAELQFLAELKRHTSQTRELFLHLVAQESHSSHQPEALQRRSGERGCVSTPRLGGLTQPRWPLGALTQPRSPERR